MFNNIFKKKPQVNIYKLNSTIVVNYQGKTHNIHASDLRFESVSQAYANDQLHLIPELVDLELQFKKKGLTIKDGVVFLNGDALPDALSKRVINFAHSNLSLDTIVKFWENLKQNPSFNSRQMLFRFLEKNGYPLTKDGCFVAYRGVREDFKDVHSNSFDNSVGSICEISRENVDDNPNNTCSHGLHVASWDYARNFGQVRIEVKVNPKDVVCVPNDYNGTKMRVCKFEVLAVTNEMNESEIYEPLSSIGG